MAQGNGEKSTHIMSSRAVTGCGTVSDIHCQEKLEVFNYVYSKSDRYLLDIITTKSSTHEEVQTAREILK